MNDEERTIRDKKAFEECLAFEEWMRNTVRSLHYADNQKMSDAYDSIMNNYINA